MQQVSTRSWAIAALVLVAGGIAIAGGRHKGEGGSGMTCGEKIAEQSKYPARLGELFTATADVWEQHAAWIGDKTPEAKRESAELRRIAKLTREMSAQAQRLSSNMLEARGMPEAAHQGPMPRELTAALERAARASRESSALLAQKARELDMVRLQLMDEEPMGTGGSGGEGLESAEQPEVPPPPIEEREERE